jgi:hypothetical protein
MSASDSCLANGLWAFSRGGGLNRSSLFLSSFSSSFFGWQFRQSFASLKGGKMKAQEIQVLKDLVDIELPKLEQAECERLPIIWQPVVKSIVATLGAQLQEALDAKIAKIPVDAA